MGIECYELWVRGIMGMVQYANGAVWIIIHYGEWALEVWCIIGTVELWVMWQSE